MTQSRKLLRAGFGLALLSLTAACVTKPSVYHWGNYEEQIYAMYRNPGSVPAEKAIEEMERDYQWARSQNKPVHPGFHAHLGYLYYQIGKFDAAEREFQTEKTKFPESAVFIDRLTANMRQKK
jgi:hypothetical protein